MPTSGPSRSFLDSNLPIYVTSVIFVITWIFILFAKP